MSLAQPATHRRRMRGGALVFTLLAMVVSAVGVTIGIDQYRRSTHATTLQQLSVEVSSVISGAKSAFGRYHYSGMNTYVAMGARIFPESRVNLTNAVAYNQFGGAILLEDNATRIAGTARLSYAWVPTAMCAPLILSTQRLARRIDIGTVTVKPLDGEVALANVAEQCKSANVLTIYWIFT